MTLNEIAKLRTAIDSVLADGKRGALVTVVGTQGSTYRRAGARCVIAEDGRAFGLISGGCVERDLAERVKSWINDMQPRVLTYDSSAEDDIVFGLGLGCRGKIEMLIEPFDATHQPELPTRAGVYETPIPEGLLVEEIEPQKAVAVFGSGADAQPVAAMAAAMGWRVELITEREAAIGEYDAAVVMTHNFLRDVAIIEQLLKTNVTYIGLLGPKSRGDEILTQIGEVDRSRVFNPIGLDLGGETPEDIALSIVAEIQAVWNGKKVPSLRDRDKPIHGGAPPTRRPRNAAEVGGAPQKR